VPSVELDDELKRKARLNADYCLEQAQKPWAMKPTFWGTEDTFYVGFLGELAVRKYLGIPLTVKRYIDFGYDLKYKTQRIDVKTSLLHEPLKQPISDGFRVFVATTEKLKCDLILFTKLEPDYSRVHLLGYINREDLDKAPITKVGDMPVSAYCVYFAFIKPIRSLLTQTTLQAQTEIQKAMSWRKSLSQETK